MGHKLLCFLKSHFIIVLFIFFMLKPNNFTDRKEEVMLYLFAWKHKQPFLRSKLKINYYSLLETHFMKLSLSYNITSNETTKICSIVMKLVPKFLLQEKKMTFWHNRKEK